MSTSPNAMDDLCSPNVDGNENPNRVFIRVFRVYYFFRSADQKWFMVREGGKLAKKSRESFLIAQLSDVHFGDPRFDKDLMGMTINEINHAGPDLVIIPGDLTANGYREQFEEAKTFIDEISCPQSVIIAGNHDCRNVGFLHFEDVFGPRYHTSTYEFGVCCGAVPQKEIRVVAADSNKPDMNDGEIGRDKYEWIYDELEGEYRFKVFILHHHLVSIPGTGRERNIVWDAGDVLAELRRAKVDLVLAGHKHVPYAWPIGGMLVVTSGTASTWRTRGYTPPSYNLIRIGAEHVEVTIKTPGKTAVAEKFPRRLTGEIETSTR